MPFAVLVVLMGGVVKLVKVATRQRIKPRVGSGTPKPKTKDSCCETKAVTLEESSKSPSTTIKTKTSPSTISYVDDDSGPTELSANEARKIRWAAEAAKQAAEDEDDDGTDVYCDGSYIGTI